jgi:hypothetical protein
VKEVPLLWPYTPHPLIGEVGRIIVEAHKTGQIPALAHLLVDFAGNNLGFVPFGYIRLDLFIYPFADFFTEGGVGEIKVW